MLCTPAAGGLGALGRVLVSVFLSRGKSPTLLALAATLYVVQGRSRHPGQTNCRAGAPRGPGAHSAGGLLPPLPGPCAARRTPILKTALPSPPSPSQAWPREPGTRSSHVGATHTFFGFGFSRTFPPPPRGEAPPRIINLFRHYFVGCVSLQRGSPVEHPSLSSLACQRNGADLGA